MTEKEKLIKGSRNLQMVEAKLALDKIKVERQKELTRMARELMVGMDKIEVLMLLVEREKLNPQEERALEAILLMM